MGALRQRHREMEAKRRRDARKIKDLQVSITPNRGLSSPEDVPFYPSSAPEEISSNTYAHHKGGAKDFFGLLHGLVAEKYSGATTYDPMAKPPQMTCTVSIMSKSASAKKAVQNNYKFVVQLWRSGVYRLDEEESEKGKGKKVTDVDTQALEADEAAHGHGKGSRECVYVVTIKRLEGDDWKFRSSVQKKLLTDGALAFNGLPEWAQKKDVNEAEKEIDAEYAAYDWKDEEEASEEVSEEVSE